MTINLSREQSDLATTELQDLARADWRDINNQPEAGWAVRQLAHDLRQPIAAIRALAAAAAADAQASELVLERLRQIGDEASWISKAIDDLLCESGARAAHGPQPAQICALVRDVVISERLTYQGRITVNHACGEARYVSAPASRLRRALANVLANATRAAGPDGAVELTEWADGGLDIIEIADNGPGFGQVTQAHGIGLQITRQVLMECGGRMEIERRPPGQTLVRLMLPAASRVTQAGVQ